MGLGTLLAFPVSTAPEDKAAAQYLPLVLDKINEQ